MYLIKKLKFSSQFLIGLLISSVVIVQACTIKITPEKNAGIIGEEIKVMISVRNQHIPCPLAITSSEVSVEGGIITSQTNWNKKNATEYEKSLTIKLTTPPKASISVKRVCDIKTSQATAQIDIQSNTLPDFKTTTLAVKETTTKLLEELGKLSSLRLNLQNLSTQEKDTKTKKKISDIIVQLDSVIKYSKKFAFQCSLLKKGL